MYKKIFVFLFLYKKIIWFPNQLQMYKEGQRILERQRFAFPPSWLYVDNIEGEWGAFNDILKRKDSSIQTQVHFSGFTTSSKPFLEYKEAAWPSGQRVGLAIRRSRVRVPLWPLAGSVLGRPEFKFSAMLVNSQLVAFCQLGFLILLCCIWIICF